MTVYLDILLFINFYVTYFQILAVCAFTHTDVPFIRRMTGSAVGALFSLAVFIPDKLYFIAAIIKIAAGFITSAVVFGFKNIKRFLKYSLILTFTTVAFAGICLAAELWFKPPQMLCKNGTLYLDIDVITLLIAIAVAYFTVRLVRFILDKSSKTDRKYTVTVHNLGNTCTMSGLADSGNSAVDYFSGMPIIICKKDSCSEVSPPALEALLNSGTDYSDFSALSGIRILPCSTVFGSGLIYTFKAESITINETGEKNGHRVNALIGIAPDSKQSYDAIFNPKLLL